MIRLPARVVCAILVTLAISSGAFSGPTTQDPNTYQYTHDGTIYTWSYGYDSSKWINGVTGVASHIVELARDPVLLTSGPYAGGYEYLFDMYNFGSVPGGTTYEIGGLDNSKILNKETYIYGVPVVPGRMTEVWSIGGSVDLAACQANLGPSYEDPDPEVEGWTDAGLTHPCPKNTDNPHSFSEYQSEAYGASSIFHADLDDSALPGVDEIVMSRSGVGATSADGLLFTVRVVLEDPVIPLHLGGTDDIWWTMASHGAGTRYDILGEFVPEPASAGLLLLGASAVLRRRRKA